MAGENEIVCCLVAERPGNMLVYLRDGSAKTSCRSNFLLHSILTPD